MATARKTAVRTAAAGKAASKKTAAPAKKSGQAKKAAPAKKAARKSAPAARSDATGLLSADHAEVQELFERYEELAESDAGEREALARRICDMLAVHAAIEEEIFYPAAREALGGDGDLLDEAEVEHASAKDLIAQIRASDAGDSLRDARVKVLGEYVRHHVEEEEGELFPRCRKAGMDLAGLAAALAERRQALLSGLEGAAGAPAGAA